MAHCLEMECQAACRFPPPGRGQCCSLCFGYVCVWVLSSWFDDQNIRILGLSHALGISWPHRFYTSMESYSFSSCNSEWLNPPCKKCWNRLLWDQLPIIWSICCMWIWKCSKTRTLENIYYRDYTLCERGCFLELIKWLFKEGRAMSHVFLILILCRLCESTSLSPLNHVGSFIHVQSAYRISDTMLSLEGEQRWVKCAQRSGSCDWSGIRRLHLSRTRARTRLEKRGVGLGRRTGSQRLRKHQLFELGQEEG